MSLIAFSKKKRKVNSVCILDFLNVYILIIGAKLGSPYLRDYIRACNTDPAVVRW